METGTLFSLDQPQLYNECLQRMMECSKRGYHATGTTMSSYHNDIITMLLLRAAIRKARHSGRDRITQKGAEH